jgi:thiol:disulfide interchange protein
MVVALLALVCGAWGQVKDYAKWTASFEPTDIRAGESGRILLKVQVEPGWHIYSLDTPPGPLPTEIKLADSKVLETNGKVAAPDPVRHYDAQFKIEVGWYAKEAIFAIPVKVKDGVSGKQTATISLASQACNDSTCARPNFQDLKVTFEVAPGAARSDKTAALISVPDQAAQEEPGGKGAAPSTAPQTGPVDDFTQKVNNARSSGLMGFLWFAFTMGLLALLTPCVYPMIPITVSFFSKKKTESDKPNYLGAFAYSFGIIGTFTALGIIVTAVAGSNGVNSIATNLWVNIALTLIFLVLAWSLFSGHELAMPSGLVNKLSGKSRTAGSIAGPLLMGFVFTLTSFTCTVPFVGTLLGAASGGDYLYPALGMLAFSTAFALPFLLLALFPQFMSKLPRSGAWMNTVKVFMGFLEIAAALKFLSNVDLNLEWGLLSRPVFLSLWATTCILAALYLFGAFKLGKEEGTPKIGWLRRGFAVVTLVGAYYCLAALDGKSIGTFSAYLPPDPYPGREAKQSGPVVWLDNFEEAKKLAKAEGKLIFIDFTGIYCTNCRLMEENVFPEPEVVKELQKFVTVKLYTDRRNPVDEANYKLQERFTKVTTLPVYAMVTADEKVLRVHQQVPPLEDTKQFLAALNAARASLVAAR